MEGRSGGDPDDERRARGDDADAGLISPATFGLVARGLAHDLNNLFTCVLVCVGGAIRLCASEEQRHNLLAIGEATRQAGALVESLRELGRAPRPGASVCSVADVLARTGLLLQRVGAQSSVRVSLQGADCHAAIDAVELQQLLVNLGMNSIEAMPEGGTLALRAHEDERSVVITVSDSGPGIDPDVAARLFERGSSSKATGERGLGLALVKGIVERRDGTISVTSTRARGTEFIVRLPARIAP